MAKKFRYVIKISMYIIETAPVAGGIPQESLSYYARNAYPKGALISVPLRSREVLAIVLDSKDIKSNKQLLRNSEFKLRSLSNKKPLNIFSPHFLRAAVETSEYFALKTPRLLDACLPTIPIDEIKMRSLPEQPKATAGFREYGIQTTREKQYELVKKIIKRASERKRSIYLACPSVEEAKEWFEFVENKTESPAFLFHGRLQGKKRIEMWKDSLSYKGPTVICGTPSFASIPRKDIDTIVLVEAGNETYRSLRDPHFDWRWFLKAQAQSAGWHIVYVDAILPTEILERLSSTGANPEYPLESSFSFKPRIEILPMKEASKDERSVQTILHRQTVDLLRRAQKEKVMLFVGRTGLFPTLVCQDCGKTSYTKDYKRQLERFETNKIREQTQEAEESQEQVDRCGSCGSWRLLPVGIGLEHVCNLLRNAARTTNIFCASSLSQTDGQTKKLIKQFEEADSGVLVTSKKGLNLLNEKVPNVVVVSIDPLLSVPDINISEQAFRLLMQIIEKTEERLLIQTRLYENDVLHHFAAGRYLPLFRQVLEDRRSFKYTPFRIHVKLTLLQSDTNYENDLHHLREFLKKYEVSIYPGFSKDANKKLTYVLVSIAPESWPVPELVSLVRFLPKRIIGEVAPARLL